MTDENPTDDIDELVEQINGQFKWNVTDYEFRGGMGDTVTVNLEVNWKAPIDRVGEDLTTVKHAVSSVDEEYGEGAPVEKVRSKLIQQGVDEEAVDAAIEKARLRGDVYETTTGHLRVV